MLASLLSGLFGAVLGFLGSGYSQWREKRERQRGAGRALLAEMLTNADRAASLSATLQPVSFADAVWLNEIATISQLLPWNDLNKIIDAYDAASRLSSDIREGSRFLDLLRSPDPSAHSVCLDRAEAFLHAVESLRALKGLLKVAERSALNGRLKALRSQILGSRQLQRGEVFGGKLWPDAPR